MKKISCILSCILLLGCAKPTPVQDCITATNQAITALEHTLPSECKNESVKAQIESIKAQIKAIDGACKAETESLKHERDKWRYGTVAMLLIFALYICRKII